MNIKGLKKYLEIEAKYKRRIAELEEDMLEMLDKREFKDILKKEFGQSEHEKKLEEIWSYEEECMTLIDNYIEWILSHLKRRKRELCNQ